MPEAIAMLKLQGYAHDYNGEVVDSVPGMIRLRLSSARKASALSWFGLGSRRHEPLMMELHLHQPNPGRGNQWHIQVVFRPSHVGLLADAVWRERCTRAYIDLRGILLAVGD